MRVGVLALQGAVSEHLTQLAALGVEGVAIKTAAELATVDALIIPGGESTAISRLIGQNQLQAPLHQFAKDKPIFGTCAGLIMCCKAVDSASSTGVAPLGLMDIEVVRNGFGRQIDSFEVPLDIAAVGAGISAVFIRAPYISKVGPGVQVLAEYEGKIVAAEQDNLLVTAFHPELTADTRLLAYFLKKVKAVNCPSAVA